MRIIAKDGVGVSALVAAARKIQAVLDEHNVALGVTYDDGGGAVSVISYLPLNQAPLDVYATIEDNPTLLQAER